jgi:hypothetical protein
MLSMSRRAMILMALLLAAATAATAATAFAGDRDCGADRAKLVAQSVYASADAARAAKLRSLSLVRKPAAPGFRISK